MTTAPPTPASELTALTSKIRNSWFLDGPAQSLFYPDRSDAGTTETFGRGQVWYSCVEIEQRRYPTSHRHFNRATGKKKIDALKTRLLRIYEDSKNKQLQKLISEMELGDQKPSQRLRRMRELAKYKIPDDTLRILWQGHLPDAIRVVLAVSETKELDHLSSIADNVHETSRNVHHVNEVS